MKMHLQTGLTEFMGYQKTPTVIMKRYIDKERWLNKQIKEGLVILINNFNYISKQLSKVFLNLNLLLFNSEIVFCCIVTL